MQLRHVQCGGKQAGDLVVASDGHAGLVLAEELLSPLITSFVRKNY
jgi:hypothetical protein